jgi:hypothetical protein
MIAMNKKDSKYKSDTSKNKQIKVEEPNVVYNNHTVSENETELHPVLIQMLEIGLKQIELGQTKPHEQVMAEMKKKYNFK